MFGGVFKWLDVVFKILKLLLRKLYFMRPLEIQIVKKKNAIWIWHPK